jgi:hypothetical protein
MRERHPPAATDPTQRIVAYWCQQDPKRQPQRGSLGVSLQMVDDTFAKVLTGHSSLAVTQRYIEGDVEASTKVVELV